jgi:hypothetical protein
MQENKNRLRLALDDAPETGNVLEPLPRPLSFLKSTSSQHHLWC